MPVLLALMAVAGCFDPSRDREGARESFRLVIASREAGRPARIEVIPPHRDEFATLSRRTPTADEWESILTLSVSEEKGAVAGKYTVADGKLIFESQFALVGGVSYQVRFDPLKVTGMPSAPIVEKFTVTKPRATAHAIVTGIYPSSDTLPCNTLKFYILFSRPMREGISFEDFQIVDEHGRAVKTPFREVELWNEPRTRLTLYIHPGRIKRGVKLREEMGTVLEPNHQYSLVISEKLQDVDGNELTAPFRKTFRTTAADHTQPNIEKWKLAAPRSNTRQVLDVELDEMLDHALLQRMITVESANAKRNQSRESNRAESPRIQGTIALANGERQWRFTPKAAWRAGTYRLMVDADLEDLVGNSLRKPFEVDINVPTKRVPNYISKLFIVK